VESDLDSSVITLNTSLIQYAL